MTPLQENHFGKRTAWLLLNFLNYAYFDILPIRKFWESVSIITNIPFISLNRTHSKKWLWRINMGHSLHQGWQMRIDVVSDWSYYSDFRDSALGLCRVSQLVHTVRLIPVSIRIFWHTALLMLLNSIIHSFIFYFYMLHLP